MKFTNKVTTRRPSIAALMVSALCLIPGYGLRAEQPAMFPGPVPGQPDVSVSSDEIQLGNEGLKAVWTLQQDKFLPVVFEDLRGGSKLTSLGEAFCVSLKSGGQIKASELRVIGKPGVATLKPDSAAAQLAARRAGKVVTVKLEDSSGRLGVVWRGILHDGANYLRQEVAFTAHKDDCEISEITFLNAALPGAQVRGAVDGSPVVAGNFFLGYEDPMAVNEVKSSVVAVGDWKPADVLVGRRQVRTWPVDPQSLKPGKNELRFRYERGAHRLDIWRVALLENGVEVAQDEHHGRTGSEQVGNVFSLVIPQVNWGVTYELIAEIGTDPDFKPAEGSPVDSFGKLEWLKTGGHVVCRLPRHATLRRGETLTQSFVVGVAPVGQMRRGFLHYLERERAHPYRPYLHYNSWYDTAYDPFALNETNCMEAIEVCGERFIKPHGVIMDGMVFDDGWDNPKSLWQFHSGFPRGFTPLAEKCRQYKTRLGVWLSPFGGYGGPKDQRLKFGREQGYEINDAGLSLAGPKYYQAFKDACVGMIRNYGVNYFKFDGIANGMYASGGGQYILDTEAMRRLMLELRQEDPTVYINLTVGSWPSPFWLRYADSLWRQGGDMGLAGKGNHQQQWLTYRDQEVFRNVVVKGPLYPLNSLMTQGVAYSRFGSAGNKTFNSAGFKDDVRAFFGSGTGLQELYIQPDKLTTSDWAVLAEAAKWSRANANVLVDTHWIGGDPAKLEVYGYASWTPRKGIVMLRNPDEQPREFDLDAGTVFELPVGAARQFTLHSPWAEDAAKPALSAQAGQPLRLVLKPFEVVILEAKP